MKESIDKIQMIAEAIIYAISEGHSESLSESPAAEAYKRLKAHIEIKYGKGSDLFQAILYLEQKTKSKSRRESVREELEENADFENDSALFKLAFNLKEYLEYSEPAKPKKQPLDSVRKVDVKNSRIGVIGDVANIEGGIHIHGNEKDWEKRYLKRVIAKCDPLDLTVTEETCETLGLTDKLPQIRVSDVFTTLYLKYPERRSDQTVKDAIEKRGEGDRFQEKDVRREEKRIPIQAVEASAAVRRMVMLGRPGGGKSTLVNYVAAQLARRRLGEQEKEDKAFGWPSEDKPLPLRIILRQMAAWINETLNRGNEGLVWGYLEHMLVEWGCAEFLPHCKQILDEEGGIIFFDGLDEVGEANEARKRSIILQAVRDFAKPLEKCRVIVSCREYAYQKREKNQNIDWRLPEAEFPVTELDLFRNEQIKAFSHAWYRTTGSRKGWNTEKCDGEAEAFYQTIMSMPNLKSLGENPLLLTFMVQIHGRKGLPKNRADLYEGVVELLLAHWENHIVRDVNGKCQIEQWGIIRLGVPVDTLREPLERVAFNAHEKQEKAVKDGFTCADISREALRTELAAKLDNKLDKAEEFIEYIEYRAGLLQAVDNRTFRFPHRTFQEYLTATGIMRTYEFEDVLIPRLRRSPSWWQEVFLLAAGSTRNTPRNIYQLLDALLAEDPDTGNLTPENVLMAQIAAIAIYESGKRRDPDFFHRPIFENSWSNPKMVNAGNDCRCHSYPKAAL